VRVILGTAYVYLKIFTLSFSKNIRTKFVPPIPLVNRVASAVYTFSASLKFHHLKMPVKPDMQRGLFELILKVLNSMSFISVGFL